MNSAGAAQPPLVSLVVVNYNCRKWLDRFFQSLRTQTLFDRAEIVIVDNTSKDGSADICEREMASWPNGVFLQTGGNFGFGGGCNRGAAIARGRYLLFLNPDVWFEPDCLEKLVAGAERNAVNIGCPLVLDYDSDTIQAQGAEGFDFFGCMVSPRAGERPEMAFAVGTFFFISAELFKKLGGFDEEFFLYSEEMDLSWRAWIADEPVTVIRPARIHHQGASSGPRNVEYRTNESKRFYANRNHLVTILKNARGLLLLLALTQFILISIEAVIGALLARRLSFLRWAMLKPVTECWRLRRHIAAGRRQTRGFRKRGDLWILRRFFRLRFGRSADVKLLLAHRFHVVIDKAWASSGK